MIPVISPTVQNQIKNHIMKNPSLFLQIILRLRFRIILLRILSTQNPTKNPTMKNPTMKNPTIKNPTIKNPFQNPIIQTASIVNKSKNAPRTQRGCTGDAAGTHRGRRRDAGAEPPIGSHLRPFLHLLEPYSETILGKRTSEKLRTRA